MLILRAVELLFRRIQKALMLVDVFLVWGGLKYVIDINIYIYKEVLCAFCFGNLGATFSYFFWLTIHLCMNCSKSRNYVPSQMLHIGNIYLIHVCKYSIHGAFGLNDE